VAAYSALSGDRLVQVVAGLGAAGCVLVALALAARQAFLLAWGIAGVGAGYAVFLSLRSGTVDPRAPFVAAAVFAAAELGFWSVQPGLGRSERTVLARRVGVLAAEAFAAALLGALLLVLATGARAGLGLEAMGVLAAVATLGIVALLTARSRT